MGFLRLGPGVVALALSACASAPPISASLPPRSDIRNFSLEARFALRLEHPGREPESASGRLSWRHEGESDRILLSNPLGQGVAEIEQDAGSARLRTGDGRVREAADAAALLRETTGYPLPLGELPAWLLGRPTASGQMENDRAGRPSRLRDAGWSIEYDYDSDAADAPPARVTLRREGELEMRLRIEEWQAEP